MQNDFTVFFDNYDLNTIPNVYFVKRNPNEEAPIQTTTHDMVRRDGRLLTSIKHDSKIIDFDGYIIAPSRTAFEQALDTLKLKTSGIEKTLIVSQAGYSRKYTATKQNIVLEHIEAGKARISLAFQANYPFGRASDLTTVNYTATSSPYGLSHTFLGTAVARPTITITVDSMTGGTTKYIGVGNSSTGQQVQVTRTWTNGDIVQFNLDYQAVYVNSAISDYSGVFPEYYPDTSTAYVYDNLTTRSLSVEMTYAAQYL